MDWKVPLADLNFNQEEEQAVLDVLRSRWLTMGSVTYAFEEEFAQFTGARFALAVSNGTVALHLACLALGIGPGDEVIVPALTFVASANAVLYTGAKVRFADILGPDELNVDPAAIEAVISPSTKAILLVHYGGYPCRMASIVELARRHNLAIIEDAAHSPGAFLDHRHLGTWGDVGCFSFFSNKNLSTGEGGMIVTNREDIAEKVRSLRSHGMTSLTWDRHQGHAHTYDVIALGYNYRLDEMRSALGRVQLKKLSEGNERRRAITQQYWSALNDSGVGLPFQTWCDNPGVEPSYHIFPLLLPDGLNRRKFMDHMRSAGIQTSIHYPPIHHFSHYQEMLMNGGDKLQATENAASREVTLPLYPGMSDEQFKLVVDTVVEGL